MYLNKVTLIGNLTRDVELKAMPNGNKVANFSIATNRVWYNDKKEKQEATEYHNVVAFGKQSETIAQYCKKGDQILVEGRLQTRSWESDGKKNYRTEIIADNVQFGSRGGAGMTGSNPSSPSADSGPEKAPDVDTIEYPDEEDSINPEDLPF